jgi:hypothetical protein
MKCNKCGRDKPVGTPEAPRSFYWKWNDEKGEKEVMKICKLCLKKRTLALRERQGEKECTCALPECGKKFMASPGTDGKYRKTCCDEHANKLRGFAAKKARTLNIERDLQRSQALYEADRIGKSIDMREVDFNNAIYNPFG